MDRISPKPVKTTAVKTSVKLSTSLRVSNQMRRLLSFLRQTGRTISGMGITKLEKIFNAKIKNYDPEIPYTYIRSKLLQKKIMYHENHICRFRNERVDKMLTEFEQQQLVDSVSTLTLSTTESEIKEKKSKKNPKKSNGVPQEDIVIQSQSSNFISDYEDAGSYQNPDPNHQDPDLNHQDPDPNHQETDPNYQYTDLFYQDPDPHCPDPEPKFNHFQRRTPGKPPVVFLNQRHGFKLSEIIRNPTSNIEAPPDDFLLYCSYCRKGFQTTEEKTEHSKSDEHVFLFQYRSNKHSSKLNNQPPKTLSGEHQGIVVQVEDEGFSTYKVNIVNEDEKKVVTKIITMVIKYNPREEKSKKQITLESTFIIFGKSNVKIIEAYKPSQLLKKGNLIEKQLLIQENEVGTKDYIVVFKFLINNAKASAFPEKTQFFVMKHISVRIDNSFTKEDGFDFIFTPSAKRHELMSNKFITTFPEVVDKAAHPPKSQNDKLKLVTPLKQYDLPSNYKRYFNFGFEENSIISVKMLKEKLTTLFPKEFNGNLYVKVQRNKNQFSKTIFGKLISLDPGYLFCNVKTIRVEINNNCECLVNGLTEQSYKTFFSLLLYLEEHENMCDLKMFSMKHVPLYQTDDKKLVKLTVPGLAENRPSVLKGDAIYFTFKEGQRWVTCQGWVYHVLQTDILVGMGQRFMKQFLNNFKVTVHFAFNRLSLRTEHRALELIHKNQLIPRICFPKKYGKYEKNKPVKKWINDLVQSNPEQAQAVQNILNGTSLPSPYLLFGPPGTGKTVTIVEAIKQIYFELDNSRILATAPSNSAADLLAERLLTNIPESKLLRMYSPSRDWSSVPQSIQKAANFQNRECYFPNIKDLLKYRIIIATLICSGRLVSGGCPVGHFTHIFVDECGHGMEPTALVPVAGLLSTGPTPGQLVLSGDPRQLGPFIRSPVAKGLGLDNSLLERLMTSCQMYQKNEDGSYNPKVLTKLVRNFRSHPDILKIPNQLFYDGDLKACGNECITHSICDWDKLPKKRFPLIFHGVEGKDEQDSGSPSFFNVAEVNMVIKYVKKLLNSKFQDQKLTPSDIGIISPYRRQIDKLNLALVRSNIHGLSVRSVEEFQGQERRVIIISTVRSNPLMLDLDSKFRLGFLREPKRFNVAITRAKALLIIIGNPRILENDPNWRCMLEWIISRGGYTGSKFELSPEKLTLPNEDGLRTPVIDKLKQQLQRANEVISKETDPVFYNSTADISANNMMEQIKRIGFFTEVPV